MTLGNEGLGGKMKPTWAQRETTCHECREKIPPRSRRFSDVVRIGRQVLRFHYHIECWTIRAERWFDQNPYTPRIGTGGRPLSDLSKDDKDERRKCLNGLSALKQYYLPRLNLQATFTELAPIELKQLQQFHKKREEFFKRLQLVGGIPERYLGSSGAPTGADAEINSLIGNGVEVPEAV